MIAYSAPLTVEPISRDSIVSIAGNLYSVPDATRRRVVEVQNHPGEVRIFEDGHRIAAIPGSRAGTGAASTRATAPRPPAASAGLRPSQPPSAPRRGNTYLIATDSPWLLGGVCLVMQASSGYIAAVPGVPRDLSRLDQAHSTNRSDSRPGQP